MISIILTAYREEKTIGRALLSIINQNIKENYELILSAPDDETLLEAKKYQKYFKKFKLIKDRGIGKPSALNMVLSQAEGDIFILTDGDVFCENIKELLKHFKDPNVGAVCGHPISVNSRNNVLGYWSNLLFDLANRLRIRRYKDRKFIFCSGYLFALRNGIIGKIPNDVLDDAYISQEVWKKGYKINYEPTALVFVKNPENIRDWIKQKKRNMYGELQLKKYRINSMRSFEDEVSYGLRYALSYPKKPKEFLWTFLLFGARFYAWLNAFIDIKIKKEQMRKIWVRVESTK